MRVLGVVRRAGTDKHGARWARIEPLVEVGVEPWRNVDRSEFPTDGRIFWPAADPVEEDKLVFCDVAPNTGGNRDQFRVIKADAAVEILDARRFGEPAGVRDAIGAGALAVPIGAKVTVLCEPDLAVGPLKFRRGASGVELDVTHPEKVEVFQVGSGDYRSVLDASGLRLVSPNAGRIGRLVAYVDWDPPERVLRRALLHAIEAGKKGPTAEPPSHLDKLTKRFVEEMLERQPPAPVLERTLDSYRLKRASEFFAAAEATAALRAELVSDLLSLPAIQSDIAAAKEHAVAITRLEANAQMRIALETEHQRLADIQAKAESARADFDALGGQLAARQAELTTLRQSSDETVKQVEAELESQLQATIAKPAERLAEVSILRALMRSTEGPHPRAPKQRIRAALPWSKAEALTDKGKFHRELSQAFRSAGVTAAAALRLHASMVSGLMPILVGAGAAAAIAAYARTACAGRITTVHVGPAFLDPADLAGIATGGELHPFDGGLADAAATAAQFDGLSMLVLEGVNRAPVESYLLPLLQIRHAGASLTLKAPLSGVEQGARTIHLPSQLRLAATAIAGPTTLPLSLDIWTSAICIEAELVAPNGQIGPPTELPTKGDLFEPAAAPKQLVDEFVAALPGSETLRRTLERFGGGVARWESDEAQLRKALLEAIALPWALTLPTDEDREEILEALPQLSPNDDHRQQMTGLTRRLRRRFG